jgi:hypothetical protein
LWGQHFRGKGAFSLFATTAKDLLWSAQWALFSRMPPPKTEPQDPKT